LNRLSDVVVLSLAFGALQSPNGEIGGMAGGVTGIRMKSPPLSGAAGFPLS